MKFSLAPDGTISVEAVNGESREALALLREMQTENVRDEIRKEKSASRSESVRQANNKNVEGSGLNELQYRTWSYLVDNDVAGGIHVSQITHAFGINQTTMNNRLINLLNMGFATRCAKGYYRAAQPNG